MVQEYGTETAEGIKISIRFSHQDVANLLHTSRVTVTKAFQFLSGEKIVLRKQNRIIILDMKRLSDLASEKWAAIFNAAESFMIRQILSLYSNYIIPPAK